LTASNGSGGAVCEKLGLDYHVDSNLAVLLKNPNSPNLEVASDEKTNASH
jgi:hypothetical protein